MARYVARRAETFWDDRMMQPLGHPQVFASEPVKTGLLNKDGHELYRMPDPIGFIRPQPKDDRTN